MDGKIYIDGFVDFDLLQHLVIIILDFNVVLMHDISEILHRQFLEDIFIVFVDVVDVPIN